MLAFSNDYYGFIFRATQSVELFCAYEEAFVSEQRAYCQGYVDCIQLLAGLGLLKKSTDMEKIISEMKSN